jgi:hypothetical protein
MKNIAAPLTKEEAQAEFERVKKAAWAELDRDREEAWAEYWRVQAARAKA